MKEERDALIEKIKSTNNGYLFSPSGQEIDLAGRYPEIFVVRYNAVATFPFRISLKQ